MISDVFCKIIKGELKAEVLYQDEVCLAIRDIHPQAPVHVLIMPKEHFTQIEDFKKKDEALLGHLLHVATVIARQENLEKGYRIIINQGEHGGQLVPHAHIHVLGGKKLGPKIIQ